MPSPFKAPDFACECLVLPLQSQDLAGLQAQLALQLLHKLPLVHRHLVVVTEQLKKAWRLGDVQPHITPIIKVLQGCREEEGRVGREGEREGGRGETEGW